MERSRWQKVVPLALLVVLALLAAGPIRSYDFFWHLATGRWIADHHALPLHDPFAIASDRTEWINGEWLFDALLYAAYSVSSLTAISWLRALTAAVIFTFAFIRAGRDVAALFVSLLAFAGAFSRLDARPLTVAALFVAFAIALLDKLTGKAAALYVLLTIVWINVHPSALLAPLLAVVVTLLTKRQLWLAPAGAAALLVNPFGYKAITAPIALMSFAGGRHFVNTEWLPSRVDAFPLLFLTIAVSVILFVVDRNRDDWWRVLLFAGFAWLAIRHVRNQPLFFAAVPLLMASAARRHLHSAAWLVLPLVAVGWSAARTNHTPGIDPKQFPIDAVARLRESGLKGNIYNPDQLGGFLIWSFYPERRTLTDGRNELYHEFIPEYARARVDSRAWRALLLRYRIDLAVDEYRAPLDVIDAATGKHQSMPASLAYWPRSEWALIAHDAAGMVFARRAAFRRDVIDRYELKGVTPDG